MQLTKDHKMKDCQVVTFLCPDVVKTWKRIENRRISTFQTFVKKAYHLARFDD